MLAGLACCVAMSMPQVHIVAYCADLGYGPARGAEMLSLMLGFGVVSRLAFGLIADRIGGIGTLIVGSVLQCLALLFYIPFDGLASLYVVSAFFGLAQGGIVPSYALIVRDYFPARQAGFRISLVLTATVLAWRWAAGCRAKSSTSPAPTRPPFSMASPGTWLTWRSPSGCLWAGNGKTPPA